MPTFESIVKSHRRKQLRWTVDSVKRLDGILQSSATDIIARLREIAGSGTIEERYKTELLNSFGKSLDTLMSNYKDLTPIHLLGSAQIVADREMAIAGQLFSADDLSKMTDGLSPSMEKDIYIQSIGKVSVSFGNVAEAAVNAIYQRVYSDGLTLSDRLWRLDRETRTAIENKVVAAIAEQKSARDLAKDLKAYLTEAGQGNARYNAMRLARTEINTTHREAHIYSCLKGDGTLKDFIGGIGFRLSASHPKPDICDVWASQDADGVGSGNYLPENVPIDHPHGLCFTVTILKSYPGKQFVTKKPEPGNVSDNDLKRYDLERPLSPDKADQMIRSIMDTKRQPTAEERKSILERISSAPFNTKTVRVPAGRRGKFNDIQVGARAKSDVVHWAKHVHQDKQWHSDTTKEQYIEDIQSAAKSKSAKLALYERHGDKFVAVISNNEIPKERLGPNSEALTCTFYSANNGIIISGYQASSLSTINIPGDALWLQ